MPVTIEYAADTVCRDNERICTQELEGSMYSTFLSDCEARRSSGNCKYSHRIFNTKRVLRLGGENNDNFFVKLEYGYGFERYGTYEAWHNGWDITVDGRKLNSDGSHRSTRTIPMALLIAEHDLGIKSKGDPHVTYEKVQSLCKAHYENSNCHRDNCRYDHDLINCNRIERLARWAPQGASPNFDFLTVECKATDGRIRWKIIMKPDAFKNLKAIDPIAQTIPTQPFEYEDDDLLEAIKHMERIIGI